MLRLESYALVIKSTVGVMSLGCVLLVDKWDVMNKLISVLFNIVMELSILLYIKLVRTVYIAFIVRSRSTSRFLWVYRPRKHKNFCNFMRLLWSFLKKLVRKLSHLKSKRKSRKNKTNKKKRKRGQIICMLQN